MFAQHTQSGAFALSVPLEYALVNAKFVCGFRPTSSAKQIAHESQYTINQNALNILDMWVATAQEFFHLTVVTLTILRRMK